MNSKLKSLKIKPRLTTSRGLSKPQVNNNDKDFKKFPNF